MKKLYLVNNFFNASQSFKVYLITNITSFNRILIGLNRVQIVRFIVRFISHFLRFSIAFYRVQSRVQNRFKFF